eukprot:10235380-Alexandrium_andersonii.AAC.1
MPSSGIAGPTQQLAVQRGEEHEVAIRRKGGHLSRTRGRRGVGLYRPSVAWALAERLCPCAKTAT